MFQFIEKPNKPKKAKKAAAPPSNGQGDVTPELVQRAKSILVPEDDETGSPIADKEGLTVSMSWAILNQSNLSSPHLSPVSSETSMVEAADDTNSISIINGIDEGDDLEAGDGTQTDTVLEAPDEEITILDEKSEHVLSLSVTQ